MNCEDCKNDKFYIKNFIISFLISLLVIFFIQLLNKYFSFNQGISNSFYLFFMLLGFIASFSTCMGTMTATYILALKTNDKLSNNKITYKFIVDTDLRACFFNGAI